MSYHISMNPSYNFNYYIGITYFVLFLIGHLQVIDFGLAKWLKEGERTRTICGTLQYIGKYHHKISIQ